VSDRMIHVAGLVELNRALRKVDTELPKRVRLALNEAADDVAAGARSLVPRRSGRAAATYRARSTRTAVRVAMGSARAPYVSWLDFGGRTGKGGSVRRPFYKQGRYLFPALRKQRPQFEDRLLTAVMGVARDAGFEVR
jgi:uncharacterized membrane protein